MMDIGKMRRGGNGGGRPGPQPLPDLYDPERRIIQPFGPGQQGLLAEQLNAGFGGGVDQWSGLLGQWTAPMRMPKPFDYGGGGRGNNGNNRGPADLTKEQMALARTWVPMNGIFRNLGQEMQFRQLDPAIQDWLRRQWGGGK